MHGRCALAWVDGEDWSRPANQLLMSNTHDSCASCVHGVVVCVSSRSQQCIQHARQSLIFVAGGLMIIISVVCVVNVVSVF